MIRRSIVRPSRAAGRSGPSISRPAGSDNGIRLDTLQLIIAAHTGGRPAAPRTALHDIRRVHRLPASAPAA